MAAVAHIKTIFANERCITAWRAEAKRVEQRDPNTPENTRSATYVQKALELLDEMYCLNNPQHKNPLNVRQAIIAMFETAAAAGYPPAMFFEGLARKEGFGCKKDPATGHALIRIAAIRKCAEALNYLALCYCRQDIIAALQLFRDAAHEGHAQGLSNFRQLAEEVRIQMKRKRKIVDFAPQAKARFRL